MDVQVLSSSSKGNCYALKCADSVLLLEAGIPIASVRKKLPQGLSCVIGGLITHEHKDHAGFARQFWDAGIFLISSEGTSRILKCVMPIKKNTDIPYKGGWKFRAFEVTHDADDPVGYVIDAPDGTRTVFATDTYLLPYRFPDVHVWMIECNYDLPLLKENIAAGLVGDALAKRILQSHMSLDHVLHFLDQQNLTQTKAIYLLHGSDRNVDKIKAVDAVRAATGKPTYMEGV